jgi:quinol monooxygenase YgiN
MGNSKSVKFILELSAQAEKREEIKRILLSLVGPTGTLDGCLKCNISQDLEDPKIFRLLEEWDTEEHLKAHIQSDDFRKIFAVMDLSSEPPRLSFDLPSGEKGMEYLVSVRIGSFQQSV